MARKLIKRWIVTTVEDKLRGIKVPVSVNNSSGRFWAEWPEGEVIIADSRNACVFAVKEAIEAHHALVWAQFIAVQIADPWSSRWARPHRGPVVGFAQLIRFERACIDRVVEDRSGKAQAKRNYRYRDYPGEIGRGHPRGDVVVFPYDEALWVKLTTMNDALGRMSAQLEELLTAAEGESPADVAARVLAFGAGPLLPGPGPSPDGIDASSPKRRKKPPPPPLPRK